ncbi:hypothetical protein L6164_031568 [Bauhinia variegata]|uniref:Uncharacterized protein n=1 Tax=Bauhinia variegata TaxID=167791 RepID=A0ACB9LFU9_BAUVA|nr:hypothetical protein L6164_031568 [Bauhinia variegata]
MSSVTWLFDKYESLQGASIFWSLNIGISVVLNLKLTTVENGINGAYLEGMSMFTTEQILRFIRRCHMKWGDFITLCKELRRIKVACLKGEQNVRRPWWAPSCLCNFPKGFETQQTIKSCFLEAGTMIQPRRICTYSNFHFA